MRSARPRSPASRCTGGDRRRAAARRVADLLDIAGQAIAKAWAPRRFRTERDRAAARRDKPRRRISGNPISTGLVGGPSACSAAGITEPAAGRAHIPEIAANQVALTGIVVQHRRQRRIAVRLRHAVAESGAHRAGIGTGGALSSEIGPVNPVSGMWQKAQASLRFTESCLSYSIALPSSSICCTWLSGGAASRRAFAFDAIDLGLDLRDFL